MFLRPAEVGLYLLIAMLLSAFQTALHTFEELDALSRRKPHNRLFPVRSSAAGPSDTSHFPLHIQRFHFQHFRLEQGFYGTPNLYFVGPTIHLQGNLVGQFLMEIRLLRNQRPLDDFVKIHD
jgi:hypothetical protein